jgi:hypothetical protein
VLRALPLSFKTCLSSSATPMLIRPEELGIALQCPYQAFQLLQTIKCPVFNDLFRHVNSLEQIIELFRSVAGVPGASESGQMFANLCPKVSIDCANSRLRVGPEISEIHTNLIRAVTCAGSAHFIGINGMAAAIGVISVEIVVRNRNDQDAVAVNVDAA